MADLAGAAVRARLDPAAGSDRARDTRAQRHEQKPADALARADPALRQPAGAHVVPERDRHPAELLGQQGPHRDVPPPEVGGIDGGA